VKSPNRRMIALLLSALACHAGCSHSDLVEVTGKVTWEGKPVDVGEIIFHPVDASITPAAGRIRAGQFRFLAKPGKKRVDIQAVRSTGKRDPKEGFEITELYIPARYNAETELEADVTPDGENHFEFALTP
jgi:hypothetical protein